MSSNNCENISYSIWNNKLNDFFSINNEKFFTDNRLILEEKFNSLKSNDVSMIAFINDDFNKHIVLDSIYKDLPLYDHNYHNIPIGNGNPYYKCASCHISDPEINGNLLNHSDSCSYREEVEEDLILQEKIYIIEKINS